MSLKTKIVLLCCVASIPPLLLPIPPILIENNSHLNLIYIFSIIAIISKLLVIVAFVSLSIFSFYFLVKKIPHWGHLYPPLVFLILSIPAWNLSNNLKANLYLNITKASQKIIVKTQTWTKETQHPPKHLNELMLIHLKKIPTQPYPFFGKFHYFTNNDQPTLYVKIPNPPFKNQYLIYSFKRPVKANDDIIETYLGWHLTTQDPAKSIKE